MSGGEDKILVYFIIIGSSILVGSIIGAISLAAIGNYFLAGVLALPAGLIFVIIAINALR